MQQGEREEEKRHDRERRCSGGLRPSGGVAGYAEAVESGNSCSSDPNSVRQQLPAPHFLILNYKTRVFFSSMLNWGIHLLIK